MRFYRPKIAWGQIAFWVIATPASLIFAWCAQPTYRDNSNSVTVLTTVFSVLAGFLIAVLAVAADDRLLRGRTWRHDVAFMEVAARDLRFHRSMFELYLTVLALAFVGALKLPIPSEGQAAIERGTLYLASMAALLSFRLPRYLTNRYLGRLTQSAKDRRAEELTKDSRP